MSARTVYTTDMKSDGRMPFRQSVFISIGSAVCVLTAATLFLGWAKPATADPHAVFYTAIGQQQLFFNMLAALNQADYVEPAKGLDSKSRESLLKKRETAGFGQETSETAKATETELAGLVSRPITLEGQDQWTQELMHLYALESARRDDMAQIIKVFCERGFGIEDCDPQKAKEDPEKAKYNKNAAFVHDPTKTLGTDPFYRGSVAAAISGLTPEDASMLGLDTDDFKIREEEWEKYSQKKGDEPVKPFEYAPNIAALRENTPDNDLAVALRELLIVNSLNSTGTSSVKKSTFNSLKFDNDGIGLAVKPKGAAGNKKEVSTDEYISTFVAKATQLFSLPANIISEIDGGAKRYDAQAKGMVVNNTMADYSLVPQGNSSASNTKTSLVPSGVSGISSANAASNNGSSSLGALRAVIDRPVISKQRQVELGVEGFVNMAGDAKYKTVSQSNEKGSVDNIRDGAGAERSANDSLKPVYADRGPSTTTQLGGADGMWGVINDPDYIVGNSDKGELEMVAGARSDQELAPMLDPSTYTTGLSYALKILSL